MSKRLGICGKVKDANVVRDKFAHISGLYGFLSKYFLVVAHNKPVFVGIRKPCARIEEDREDVCLVLCATYERRGKWTIMAEAINKDSGCSASDMDPLNTRPFAVQFVCIIACHHFRFCGKGLRQGAKEDVLVRMRGAIRKGDVRGK